jgi:hypothetical protein
VSAPEDVRLNLTGTEMVLAIHVLETISRTVVPSSGISLKHSGSYELRCIQKYRRTSLKFNTAPAGLAIRLLHFTLFDPIL